MTAMVKVLVVLDAILEVVAEALEMRCLSFLIWVFLYCRIVFSLFWCSVDLQRLALLVSVVEMSWH